MTGPELKPGPLARRYPRDKTGGRSAGLAFALVAALCFPAAVPAQPEPSGEVSRALSSEDLAGQELLEAGSYEQAAEHFRGLMSREPDSVQACIGLGTALCRQSLTEEAMEVFGDCLSRRPAEASLYFSRGLCGQGAGGEWLAPAEADYKKALSLDVNNASAHNQLGLILQARGRHEEAMTYFQAAIRLDPSMIMAYNNLGASMIALGRYREAIVLIQKAISLAPDLTGVYLYTNLGVAFLYAGYPQQAEAAFLMETALNPGHLEAHLNLGNLYSLSHRYSEAVWEYNRVLISDPENRKALINIGAAYAVSGRPAQARSYLEKAVKLYPDSALAHHYLGQSYLGLGMAEAAEQEESKARELGYNESGPAWPGPPP